VEVSEWDLALGTDHHNDPSHVTLEGEGVNFLDCVHDCADQDNSVIQALKELGTD